MTKKSAQPAGDSPPKPKQAAKPAQKPATEPKRPRGRQTTYTKELADEICARVASGESLKAICKDDHMPTDSTVRLWVIDNREGFAEQYTRAFQARAMLWGEEIIGISDDGANDTYIDDEGNERVDHDHIARSRLRVDTRKWMLSKMLPKVFGDKLDVNHGVQPDNPLASVIQRIAGTGLPIVPEAKEE